MSARQAHPHPLSRGLLAAAALLASVGTGLIAASGSNAARLEVGFGDGLFTSADAGVRDLWFDRALDARASVVRINVNWRGSVGASRPANPRNANDPAYDFGTLDAAIQDAVGRGLDVLLTVSRAPAWAEGEDRPNGAPAGSWKPRSDDVEDFAHALAERYSGAAHPRVRFFQAWVEPNLTNYLTPQALGGKMKSPGVYRRLLNAFYAGVKSVHQSNTVVSAGTAPYGGPVGGGRTRPLAFWRKVLCLAGRRSLDRTRCSKKAHLDVLAHHPINTSGGPGRSAIHPDDASTPDLKNLRRILRAAERQNTLRPNGRRPLWATEIWWESDPPDDGVGVKVRQHARWYETALYSLWKQGATAVILLQIADSPYDPQSPNASLQSGIFFDNGTPKPAFRAVQFPFVTERRSRERVRAWTRPPLDGQLRILRRRSGEWQVLKRADVTRGKPFQTKLRLRGSARLRAEIGALQSLTRRQEG